MRKFAIMIFIAVLIGLDTLTKWFFGGIFQGMVFGCPNTPLTIGCNSMSDAPTLFRYFPILGDWLGIQLSYNRGIAFSLPLHGLPLQIVTPLLIAGLLSYYLRSEYPKKNNWIDAGFALIIAGALAHGYERIFVGHVVDFIAVKYFAILNFADIFISIGVFLIIFYYYFYERKSSGNSGSSGINSTPHSEKH